MYLLGIAFDVGTMYRFLYIFYLYHVNSICKTAHRKSQLSVAFENKVVYTYIHVVRDHTASLVPSNKTGAYLRSTVKEDLICKANVDLESIEAVETASEKDARLLGPFTRLSIISMQANQSPRLIVVWQQK